MIEDLRDGEGFEKMVVLRDEMAEGVRVESGRGEADEEGSVESEDGVILELDP